LQVITAKIVNEFLTKISKISKIFANFY